MDHYLANPVDVAAATGLMVWLVVAYSLVVLVVLIPLALELGKRRATIISEEKTGADLTPV